MNLIEEIKETLSLEIRPNSQGSEYLEAVVDRMELESLQTILIKHLGGVKGASNKWTRGH